MLPQSYLAQLQRDAAKAGAWQAKLAYAEYLLQFDPSKKSEAQKHLEEIIQNGGSLYKIEATKIVETQFRPANLIKHTALRVETQARKDRYGDLYSQTSTTLQAPEIQYKLARYRFDQNILSPKQFQSVLQILLNREETTDTLSAKIYFQLIRINIENAAIKGQHTYLHEAKKYCLMLMENPRFKNMNKAQEAKKIYEKIQKLTDANHTDFTTHITNSFGLGKTVSTKILKYVGIVIGNLADLSLLFIPKLVGKYKIPTDHFEARNGKSKEREFFKNGGFALIFKELGRMIGKHIIGNLVLGPIGALLGLLTYPIISTYYKYRSNQDLQALAEETIKLDKGNYGPNGSDKSSNKQSYAGIAKRTIFQTKNVDPNYGNISDTSSTLYVIPTYYNPDHPRAYGRVFGNPQKPIFDTVRDTQEQVLQVINNAFTN